ncbi:hypothetical protein Q8F55_002024 [Vanrija albida]|uniref:DNA damage-binding protein 1 n=1 Tax=Vanrija albida TaxID=181172 RepID=A0ABR3Q8L5_9TREE
MLYIASALSPTVISHTAKVHGFTSSGSTSLVIARPDRIEVWDVSASGLQRKGELKVWGTIVGLDVAAVPDAPPHILVLVEPPSAKLLLVTFTGGKLTITASQPLSPPMPSLARAEFFTGVRASGSAALVSLWTGLLACVEIEFEKAKDAKKRRASEVLGDECEAGARLVFKSSFNINIREHNLLDIAFAPGDTSPTPLVAFLWMTENNRIQLQPKQLSIATHSFTNAGAPIDVVNPLEYPVNGEDQDLDFNAIPFSTPAARNLLAVPGHGPNDSRQFFVIGDEHATLYSIAVGPSAASAAKVAASPRASAIRRSPQAETGGIGKKRKSSTSGRGINTDADDRWNTAPVWRTRQGFGTVLAATVLDTRDKKGGSVLLGDESGRLTAVGWDFEDADNVRVSKVDLGSVSPPTSLTYLDNGYAFVSSACGDSLLVSVDLPAESDPAPSSSSAPRNIARKGKGRATDTVDVGTWTIHSEDDGYGSVEVRERWLNIAPVKDFTVVKEDDGRVSHLVVGSGSATSNSLRVIRSGVGLDTVLTVEGVTDVQGMWSLASRDKPTLLLSFPTSSALLDLSADVSVVPVAAEISSSPTVAAGLVNGGSVLAHATPAAVKLWTDTVAGVSLGSYEASEAKEIVAADIKHDHILVAHRNGDIAVLKANPNGLEQILLSQLPAEAASIALHIGSNAASSFVAGGAWNNDIEVFSFESLRDRKPLVVVKEATFAASLLIRNASSGHPQLVAGLSDGTVVTYSLEPSNLKTTLDKGRYTSSAGSRPAILFPLDLLAPGGEEHVVAAAVTESLSIMFEARNHLEISSSGEAGVLAAASVSTPTLGNAIVLATEEGLKFEAVSSLKKLQVQTLDLGQKSATRLAVVSDLKVLAAGTVTRSLDSQTGDVLQSSSLEIRDPTTLELFAEYTLPERETVASVNTVLLNGRHYIALGTAIFGEDDTVDVPLLEEMSAFISAEKGRLILLEPTNKGPGGWFLDVATTFDAAAAVLDAKAIHGFLAVASSTKVSILRLDASPATLREVSASTFAFEAHYLHVSPANKVHDEDRLVVGDAMRSILILDIDDESGVIRSDQRDMASHSVRALDGIEDGGPGVIIADSHSNLLTLRLNEEIERGAHFGLHEDVARLRIGSLAPPTTSADVLRPELLFATTSGRLGIIGELGTSAARTLGDLQRNMDKHFKGPGGVDWKTLRRGGTSLLPKETAGFIDGDFVQQFADGESIPEALVDRILRGTSAAEVVSQVSPAGTRQPATREDVVRVLEAAAGLH